MFERDFLGLWVWWRLRRGLGDDDDTWELSWGWLGFLVVEFVVEIFLKVECVSASGACSQVSWGKITPFRLNHLDALRNRSLLGTTAPRLEILLVSCKIDGCISDLISLSLLIDIDGQIRGFSWWLLGNGFLRYLGSVMGISTELNILLLLEICKNNGLLSLDTLV